MLRRCLSFAILFALFAGSATAQTPAAGVHGFYRFPAFSGETIVFAAEGTDPVISPDGKLLHRTVQYSDLPRKGALVQLDVVTGTRVPLAGVSGTRYDQTGRGQRWHAARNVYSV